MPAGKSEDEARRRRSPGEAPREAGSWLSSMPLGRFAAVFLALYVVSVFPLFWFETPSLLDHSNHLARVYILRNEEAFRTFYVPAWAALPNLAFDVVVGGLSRWMPLPIAGKVFASLVLLQLALGAVILYRHFFREWALWPCVSFAFLYNRSLPTGALGYLFGFGLALLATAVWLRSRGWPPWARLGIGAALSTALFFTHLMALGLYGLVAFSTELAHVTASPAPERRRSLRGLLVAAAQGIPPVLVFLFLSPRSETSGRIVFRSLWTRLEAFATPFFVYDAVLDLALAALLFAAVLYGLRTRRLKAPREVVVALAALCAAQMAMPYILMTGEGADRRLPIAIAMLFFAGTRLEVRSGWPAKALAAGLLILFLTRMAGVFEYWRSSEPAYENVRVAMSSVGPGSRVLTAFPHDALATGVKRSIAVYYMPAWETVKRHGFNPTLFAIATQQPVQMVPEAESLARALSPGRMWACHVGGGGGSPEEVLDAGERAALGRYDYVVFVDNEPFALTRTEGLALVADTPCAKLYRVSE